MEAEISRNRILIPGVKYGTSGWLIKCSTLEALLMKPCISLVSVVTAGKIYILDLAAKIDQTAEFLCKAKWGEMEFPPPFGRDALPEVSLSQ